MRKGLEIGGVVAAVVLIAFGVAAVIMGASGKSTVEHSLTQEQIVGTPDMTPKEINAEVSGAGLADKVDTPTCSVANQAIDSGDNARCFAQYMRVHAMLATGGYTYSQMGRFEALPNTPKGELAPGGGTENEKFAALDPETKQPVENGAREVWVTETALSTALNASYMADRALDLRDRHRHRPVTDRVRIRRPRRRRGGSQSRHRAQVPAPATTPPDGAAELGKRAPTASGRSAAAGAHRETARRGHPAPRRYA